MFLAHAVELRRLAGRMLALAAQRARLGDAAPDRHAVRRLLDIAAAMTLAADRSEAVWRQRSGELADTPLPAPGGGPILRAALHASALPGAPDAGPR